jgi:hypothetical protein
MGLQRDNQPASRQANGPRRFLPPWLQGNDFDAHVVVGDADEFPTIRVASLVRVASGFSPNANRNSAPGVARIRRTAMD